MAHKLNVNLKTARSMANTDREYKKKNLGRTKKWSIDDIMRLKSIVEENVALTLLQIRTMYYSKFPACSIVSPATIDRYLDGISFTVKKLTLQPADRNRADVIEARRHFADWFTTDGSALLRIYVDQTNFNIWCSRSTGRSVKGEKAVKTVTASKGCNLIVIAAVTSTGLLLYKTYPKVSRSFFIICKLFRLTKKFFKTLSTNVII